MDLDTFARDDGGREAKIPGLPRVFVTRASRSEHDRSQCMSMRVNARDAHTDVVFGNV